MTYAAATADRSEDPVSNVLKWVLLATAVLCTVDLTTGWTPAYSLDGTEAQHGELPDLFSVDDRGVAARHELVVDQELAVRARGRQYAHNQYFHLDLG